MKLIIQLYKQLEYIILLKGEVISIKQIELTTVTQINYHLQMGEYVIFNIEDGFGFLKQNEEEGSGIFNDKGIELVVQTNDGAYHYDAPNRKGAYVEMLKGNFIFQQQQGYYI